MRAAAWLAALALCGSFALAEPRATYTEIVGRLRRVELELGVLEHKADRVKDPTVQDWDSTTQALTRMETAWKECQAELDAANPPKHEKHWARTQAMLISQRELALKCGYVVQLRYQLGDPKGPPPGVSAKTLDAVKKELPGLRATYARAATEASRDL